MLRWLNLANVAVLAFAVAHGWIDSRDPGRHSDSIYVVGFSAVQMVATAIFALRIFNVRRSAATFVRTFRNTHLVWALIGAGFLYLPLDEVLGLHQALDGVVHRIFGLHETALSDRLDDAIIAAYGLIGVVVIVRYWTELRPLLVRRWIVLGFVFLGVAVVIDALTNRPDVALWLVGEPAAALQCNGLFKAFEALAQLIAESLFLVAFYSAWRRATATVLHHG